MNLKANNLLPFYIAAGIALVVTFMYIASGRGSLDVNTRELTQNKAVKAVETGDPQKIPITCKNGERYQIIFTEDQTNYNNLIFNACGAEGLKQ